MKYDELIQLYFERSNALQAYWTLYVVIVGGMLAFSSLRKLPAAVTTLIVTLLFGLFAYENMDAIMTVTRQRHATLAAIKQSDSGSTAAEIKPVRDLLEPTLTPATGERRAEDAPRERSAHHSGPLGDGTAAPEECRGCAVST